MGHFAPFNLRAPLKPNMRDILEQARAENVSSIGAAKGLRIAALIPVDKNLGLRDLRHRELGPRAPEPR